MKKLMHNTVAAAGIAALLLLGACATHDTVADNNDVTELRPEAAGQEATVAPAPGPVKVDSDGNIYSTSNAPGKGNPSQTGTNTKVNIIPEKSSATVTESALVTTEPTIVETTTTETTVDTTPSVTTETRTETTTVPMTSATQETTTTTETTPTRTRMRKD